MRFSLPGAVTALFGFFVLSPVMAEALLPEALLSEAVPAAQAQTGENDDLDEIVALVGEQYVRGYATGLLEASSAALGSSLFFESGQANDLLGPINLYVGLRGAAVPVGGSEASFNLEGQSSGEIRLEDGTLRDVEYTYRTAASPTAFGESTPESELTVTARYLNTDGEMTTEEFTADTPQGLLGTLSFLPSVVPQAGVGIPSLGLRVSARFTPTFAFVDVGRRLNNLGVQTVEGALYGIGARQSVGAWTERLPFELSIYGYYQHVGIAVEEQTGRQDLLRYRLLSGGANASVPVIEESSYSFSLFAGFGGQMSTARFRYETPPEEESFSSTVDFTLESPVRLRAQAGFSTRSGPFMVNLGYAPIPRHVILGGIGLAF